MADKTKVQQALAWFRMASTAETDQRKREQDDLACQVPENLWPDDVKRSRGSFNAAGVPLPARPMLSIPMLEQPIQLVLNQEKGAQLGAQIHPLSEDADDDTAEMLQGLYRSIEVRSRAAQARSWAFERAVKAGRGWYRILKAYDVAGGHPSDQEIRITRILNQGSVYGDPFAQEPDKSDMEWLLQVEDVPVTRYKRMFPKSKVSGMDDSELVGLGSEQPGWINGSDEASRTIRVAEVWSVEHDDEAKEAAEGEADSEATSRDRETRSVYWCKINCCEELESTDWEGQWIPYVFVPGRELQPWDQEPQRYVGIIGPNKEAARLFNYAASGAVEAAALEPKAPFDVDPEEIEGYEQWWQQANVRNFPYLPRRKFLHGQVMPQIGRIQADGSKMQINLALLNQAAGFIHSGTGAFEPSLGQQSEQAKSGRAVLALQQQHDQGNSNWLDNLAEISMTHEARIVLDLIPYVYDRPGRVLRILDLEDNAQSVIVNQPFVPAQGPRGRPQPLTVPGPAGPMGQPGPAMPMPGDHPAMPPAAKHFDLNKGRYGVTVSIGKAYKSRVEQGADELGQLFQAEPQLFQILGDIYLKFRDFPGHMEAAERVKKMLPPALQAKPDGGPDPQQMAQLQGKMQEMGQALQQAHQALATDQAKQQAETQRTQLEQSAKVEIERMKNATALAVAEINARAKGVLSATEAQFEAIALRQQQQHESDLAAQSRAHDVGMAHVRAAQQPVSVAQPPPQDAQPMVQGLDSTTPETGGM